MSLSTQGRFLDLEINAESGAEADVASDGIMESSSVVTLQDRVTRYLTHGINGGCVCRLSIFGLVLVVVGSIVDGKFDSVVTVGWVLFSLPFLCFGLVVIIFSWHLFLLGIGEINRGMRGASLVEAAKGMIVTTQSSIVLVAMFDIALYASDNLVVVLLLPLNVFCVGFIMAIFFRIVLAATLICHIKRWGIILQAKVHQRRRHPRQDGNGMVTYEHQLLVTFNVEKSHPHQPCWRKFGCQRVSSSSSNTEANSVDEEEDEMEMESVVCEESNEDRSLIHSHILDEGCPVQSGDNVIPYTRQSIKKWLTVNESQYESSNNFVEVSALPCWPQISVTTETLPSFRHAVFEVIAFTSLAAVASVICVSGAREMIFEDDDIPWHVKASHVLVSILLPSLPLAFMIGSAPLEAEESGSHVPNEISPELPMVEQSTRGSR